jgi:hypothetical protein
MPDLVLWDFIVLKKNRKIVGLGIKRTRQTEFDDISGRHKITVKDDGGAVGRIGELSECLAAGTIRNVCSRGARCVL